MKIQNLTNPFQSQKASLTAKKQPKKNVSFSGVFIDAMVDLGAVKEKNYPPVFLKKDSLLLNQIAQQYPNQDCFIRKGDQGLPRLEYRERPSDVQVFEEDFAARYKMYVNPIDDNYPCEPLIIYPESDYNSLIGVTSFISTNPSLPYTVKVGFELHKKLIEKKMQIMDIIGSTDMVEFGNESIIQKAHKAIEETEIAVIRYLVDCAYAAIVDRASAKQIYESDYLKIQSVLDSIRRVDLTTSVAKQAEIIPQDISEVDIIDKIMKKYPDHKDNKDRLDEILNFMRENGMSLERRFDTNV